MANNSGVNLDISNLSIGFSIGGGTTKRTLTVNGSGNTTLTSQQSIVLTLPNRATDTVVGYGDYSAKGVILVGTGSGTFAALTVGADGNVAVGASALQSATTAELNLAAGVSSLKSCTIGDNNVALGAACLQQLVDGSFNTCGGEFAGFNYTGTESYNVILAPAYRDS